MQQSGEPSVEEILDSIKKVIARDAQAAPMQERRTTAFNYTEPAADEEAAEVLELNEDEIFRDTHNVGLSDEDEREIDYDTRNVGLSDDDARDIDYDTRHVGLTDEDEDTMDRETRSAIPLTSFNDPHMIDDDGFGSDFEPAEVELREETAEDCTDAELVGQVATDRVRANFASLGDALGAKSAGTPDAMGSSLEGMVREMLRPMLREWMDANLPTIVESIVRDEIERIARR